MRVLVVGKVDAGRVLAAAAGIKVKSVRVATGRVNIVTTELALPPELCVHWFRIAYPNGPISIGKLKKCGQEREYRTPYDGTIYNNYPAQKFPKIALARAEDRE